MYVELVKEYPTKADYEVTLRLTKAQVQALLGDDLAKTRGGVFCDALGQAIQDACWYWYDDAWVSDAPNPF